MRGHKAQERLRLLGKVNTEEKQTPRQRTNNYWNWWPSYKSVKNGRKM